MTISNIKLRKKLLEKIGQATVTPTSPTAIPPVTNFRASLAYPIIQSSFSPINVGLIDQLCAVLHTALHYSSGGKYNFQTLKNVNFTLDPSIAPSPDTKNLIILSEMVFKSFLNNPAKLSSQQIDSAATNILNSQELSKLSSVNPSGPIAQKIPGNLRNNISIILSKLISANPIQAT